LGLTPNKRRKKQKKSTSIHPTTKPTVKVEKKKKAKYLKKWSKNSFGRLGEQVKSTTGFLE